MLRVACLICWMWMHGFVCNVRKKFLSLSLPPIIKFLTNGTIFAPLTAVERERERDSEGGMKGEDVKELELNNNSKKTNEDDDFKKFNGESDGFSRLLSLFGSKDRDFLLSPPQTQVKISDLQGKIIGILFSANWYPPCQEFTRVLANTYEQLRHNNPPFEVVFVSSDEDLDAFNNYHSSMPWLAVPFSDLETKRALNRRFDVEGIPCLIILQPNKKVGTAVHDGVDLIYRYGVQGYPFTEEKLEELMAKEIDKHNNQTLKDLLTNHERDFLLGHTTQQVPVTSLAGKTVGVYFSAQWCLPGVKFTPKLISIYQKIKQELAVKGGEDFEIVFISSDYDQTTFDSHFQTMPWLALPFGDPLIKDLAKYFDVRGIPNLVILGPDGKTVTKHGRNLMNLYQENAYPFTKARIELLERQVDEEFKNLPTSTYHEGHHHGLMLVSEGNGGGPFICCDCDEQGSGWAYQCIECGYEVHPKCVRVVGRDLAIEG